MWTTEATLVTNRMPQNATSFSLLPEDMQGRQALRSAIQICWSANCKPFFLGPWIQFDVYHVLGLLVFSWSATALFSSVPPVWNPGLEGNFFTIYRSRRRARLSWSGATWGTCAIFTCGVARRRSLDWQLLSSSSFDLSNNLLQGNSIICV